MPGPRVWSDALVSQQLWETRRGGTGPRPLRQKVTGRALLRQKVTGAWPPWGGRHGRAGRQAGATRVADATNVAPPPSRAVRTLLPWAWEAMGGTRFLHDA